MTTTTDVRLDPVADMFRAITPPVSLQLLWLVPALVVLASSVWWLIAWRLRTKAFGL